MTSTCSTEKVKGVKIVGPNAHSPWHALLDTRLLVEQHQLNK